MNIACQVALVRFAPFVETGEFANVGVVVFAPDTALFAFKLLPNTHKRVQQFFAPLDKKVYAASLERVAIELARVQAIVKQAGKTTAHCDYAGAKALWAELLKPREGLMRFATAGVELTTEPQQLLDAVFTQLLLRDFVTPAYAKEKLDRTVRAWLVEAKLELVFKAAKLGDDVYHARFEFIAHQNDRAIKLIKPLDLRLRTPTDVINAGGKWRTCLHQLQKRDLIPEQTLFTVDGDFGATGFKDATLEVMHDLRTFGVTVEQHQQAVLLDFARA